MNENIDLTNILKDCPKGTKFYSSIYGDLLYSRMYLGSSGPKITFIKPDSISSVDYCQDGKRYSSQGECTLFPSKDQRDWSKFAASWYKKEKFDPKTLQPYDKVLVRDGEAYMWKPTLLSYINNAIIYPYVCTNSSYRYCIPYNDNTKYLAGTKEEAPEYYRYWKD